MSQYEQPVQVPVVAKYEVQSCKLQAVPVDACLLSKLSMAFRQLGKLGLRQLGKLGLMTSE